MKRLMLVSGVCAFALNGLAAENFIFAPNVEPKPVTMLVESNTLVRLDRSQTVTIACLDGSERAAEWAEARFEEWFRLTKTGWFFPSVNAPRVVAAAFAGAPAATVDCSQESCPSLVSFFTFIAPWYQTSRRGVLRLDFTQRFEGRILGRVGCAIHAGCLHGRLHVDGGVAGRRC